MEPETPEDYERLGEHLKEIDPIFQRFLEQRGYVDYTGTLGRYPHRSAIYDREFLGKIDFQMEWDESGQRFGEFDPSIPYHLWVGTWVDAKGYRYPGPSRTIFEKIEYREAARRLEVSLAEAAHFIEEQSREEIMTTDDYFKLPTIPES